MRRILGALAVIASMFIFAGADEASAQVEYVRVCSIYGAGFFYIPGTDTCVNSRTGETRKETISGTVFGKTDIAKDAETAAEGAAAAAALSRPFVETGHNFAIAGDVAAVEEQGAASLGAALRLNENLTVSGSAAFAEGNASASRAGFNLSW